MKKLLTLAVLVGALAVLTGEARAGQGNAEQYVKIDSSGTVAITFDQTVDEIEVVTLSTNTCYVIYASTSFPTAAANYQPISGNIALLVRAVNEIKTSKMAVSCSLLPVDIHIKGKYWQ